MKKKILAAFVCAAMVLSLTACGKDDDPFANLPQSSAGNTVSTPNNSKPASSGSAANSAAESKPEEISEPASSNVADFEYTEEDGKITITGYKGRDTAVVFPKTIDGKPVDAIDGVGLRNDVTSVVIPDGVTTIGDLSGSTLTDITIPKSVTNFINPYDGFYHGRSYEPFGGTAWLEKKRAENPLVIVNNIVIDGKTCTRSVEIPEGVKAIADSAFSNCTTVTNITLPKSLEKIGKCAFLSCSRLADIVLPDRVSSIGDYAFVGCSALENVTFPNNTVEMGFCIFGFEDTTWIPWIKNMQADDPLVIVNGNLINAINCEGDVVVPDGVKSIAVGAFAFNNPRIKSITLPNGITEIPTECFLECYDLESVTIPNSVTEIGEGAFYRCDKLTSITIPNSVTHIGNSAFFGCGLTSITIPNSVTHIGNGVFSGCGLTSITIPNSVTHIGNSAFSGCGLTSITIPDSVTFIGDDAFNNCYKLTSVTLPDNIKHLGENAFKNADITYRGEIYFPELYNELYAEIEKNNG